MQLQLMLACLATALMGGIFFAFSSFIMTALGRIPASEGIRAMQRINIDVFTWSFEWTFLGTPALCLALLVQALQGSADERAPWIIAGAVIYLLGCLLVTGLGNVPLNQKLALEPSEGPGAALAWRRFASPWVRWNHLRSAACLVSAACFLMALL